MMRKMITMMKMVNQLDDSNVDDDLDNLIMYTNARFTLCNLHVLICGHNRKF